MSLLASSDLQHCLLPVSWAAPVPAVQEGKPVCVEVSNLLSRLQGASMVQETKQRLEDALFTDGH